MGMLVHDRELVLPFKDDSDLVVAESCEIALGLIDVKQRVALLAESKSDEHDNYGEEENYNYEECYDDEEEQE